MTVKGRVFIPIDRDNVIELMFLSVQDDEKHLISPNAEWLAQAPHVEESQTYGHSTRAWVLLLQADASTTKSNWSIGVDESPDRTSGYYQQAARFESEESW